MEQSKESECDGYCSDCVEAEMERLAAETDSEDEGVSTASDDASESYYSESEPDPELLEQLERVNAMMHSIMGGAGVNIALDEELEDADPERTRVILLRLAIEYVGKVSYELSKTLASHILSCDRDLYERATEINFRFRAQMKAEEELPTIAAEGQTSRFYSAMRYRLSREEWDTCMLKLKCDAPTYEPPFDYDGAPKPRSNRSIDPKTLQMVLGRTATRFGATRDEVDRHLDEFMMMMGQVQPDPTDGENNGPPQLVPHAFFENPTESS